VQLARWGRSVALSRKSLGSRLIMMWVIGRMLMVVTGMAAVLCLPAAFAALLLRTALRTK
jgi:hypothetical protein